MKWGLSSLFLEKLWMVMLGDLGINFTPDLNIIKGIRSGKSFRSTQSASQMVPDRGNNTIGRLIILGVEHIASSLSILKG
jgi:hypothetical protein